jgi:hypothetical protein
MARKSKKSSFESLTDPSAESAEDTETSEDSENESEGQNVDETAAIENPNPKDESEHAVEPDEEIDISIHISKAGNKVFDEGKARENIGKIHNDGTTAAYIEVVVPRQPGLEAALRGAATAMGLADGSIKPEDAPGNQIPEGARNPNDGGNPEDGNSITGATKPTENPDVNPNSPVQVGDTKETAQAASNAKIENGDAVGEQKPFATGNPSDAKDGGIGELKDSETTIPSSATDVGGKDFVLAPAGTEQTPDATTATTDDSGKGAN